MSRKPKFRPAVTRIKLNPEQAVLTCSCYHSGWTLFDLSSIGREGGMLIESIAGGINCMGKDTYRGLGSGGVWANAQDTASS